MYLPLILLCITEILALWLGLFLTERNAVLLYVFGVCFIFFGWEMKDVTKLDKR